MLRQLPLIILITLLGLSAYVAIQAPERLNGCLDPNKVRIPFEIGNSTLGAKGTYCTDKE